MNGFSILEPGRRLPPDLVWGTVRDLLVWAMGADVTPDEMLALVEAVAACDRTLQVKMCDSFWSEAARRGLRSLASRDTRPFGLRRIGRSWEVQLVWTDMSEIEDTVRQP
jgi:hypothetical protein